MTFHLVIDANTAIVQGSLNLQRVQEIIAELRGSSVGRLILGVGTVLEPDSIALLAALDLEVVAESPYLARWIERVRATEAERKV